MSEARIRLGVPADDEQVARLCEALWPESSWQEHREEIAPILVGKPRATLPSVILVAELTDGTLAGFLEVGLRSHADGCDTRHPVGFVEGWFVKESLRRRGVGAQLLAAAEDWARSQGCVEIASDTWIDSNLSQRVHEMLKFEVVDRCVHYRKAL
jgi:aminoglycoside 6'-N-acetyltransferase I